MTASKDPRYTKATRTASKAYAALAAAEKHLMDRAYATYGDDLVNDMPYAEGAVLDGAVALLHAAGGRVNAELKAVTKAVGVGRYQPYGRKFQRRW